MPSQQEFCKVIHLEICCKVFRAKSIRTGYWLRPDPDNAAYAIILYLTQTDPCGTVVTYVMFIVNSGMIPHWIVNKATKTFAPKLLENLMKVGPKYPDWKAANNPDAKPWLAIGKSYWWEKKDEEKSEKSQKSSSKGKRSKSPKKAASPRKKKDESESVKSDEK